MFTICFLQQRNSPKSLKIKMSLFGDCYSVAKCGNWNRHLALQFASVTSIPVMPQKWKPFTMGTQPNNNLISRITPWHRCNLRHAEKDIEREPHNEFFANVKSIIEIVPRCCWLHIIFPTIPVFNGKPMQVPQGVVLVLVVVWKCSVLLQLRPKAMFREVVCMIGGCMCDLSVTPKWKWSIPSSHCC